MASRFTRSPLKQGSRELWLCLVITAMTLALVPLQSLFAQEPATFTIKSFIIDGNTLLAATTVQEALHPYTGPDKTADDVEKARGVLEKVYHDAGYPAVLVNIPEQTTEKGLIRLQVIESTIGSVKVTGNRWFTQGSILRDLPSLAPGQSHLRPRCAEGPRLGQPGRRPQGFPPPFSGQGDGHDGRGDQGGGRAPPPWKPGDQQQQHAEYDRS